MKFEVEMFQKLEKFLVPEWDECAYMEGVPLKHRIFESIEILPPDMQAEILEDEPMTELIEISAFTIKGEKSIMVRPTDGDWDCKPLIVQVVFDTITQE
jgi:hypothetical protein